MENKTKKRKMEKQIIVSDEYTLYEIFKENGYVKGGFNYTQSQVMTVEEAKEILKSLTIPEEILNEQIFSSSIEH